MGEQIIALVDASGRIYIAAIVRDLTVPDMDTWVRANWTREVHRLMHTNPRISLRVVLTQVVAYGDVGVSVVQSFTPINAPRDKVAGLDDLINDWSGDEEEDEVAAPPPKGGKR